MMNNILNQWPENLKGYDYRIHIVKDETINAFAVLGGICISIRSIRYN